MDMEMDIPAPEELEWLESNALLPEEEEVAAAAVDEEEWMIEEGRDPSGFPAAEFPDLLPDSENQICRKRPLSVEEEGLEDHGKLLTDDGRAIRRRSLEDEQDEDWFRYSPPKDAAADAASEMDDAVPAVPEEKILSRFASEIEGDCMPVTGPSGDRVYAKMSSAQTDVDHRKLIRENPANGLLYEPFSALIRKVEQEAFTKALQESIGSPCRSAHSKTSTIVSEKLWVEKYAPNSFKELLSDEQTNREVLLWLKQWDSCVFGTHIRATTDDVLYALRQHSSIVQHQKTSDRKHSFSKGAPFNNLNLKSSDVLDGENYRNDISESLSRKSTVNHPLEQKILLLCGPPGLGKTTLAHVAAKHCGYGVVEINASDDRSSSTFESKILDVMQMKSVMGDTKPKCLVIDEIDGALGEGKGAVDVILKMVAAEKKSTVEKGKTDQETQPGKTSLRKGHKTTKLLRPVICICNDLYAPALRPLRQVAKVHMFVQPTVSRVVNRLKYICKKERFKTSSIALSALAEYTECDIRSCLNTLQFLRTKNETLSMLDVGSQVVGQKDLSRSAFDVWKEVFQKRKLKGYRKSKNGCTGLVEFDFLYSLISNCGDYELTMNGIHENFLRLSYHDPMMQKTVRCLDALGVSDSLLQYILRTQHMSLHVYQPPIAIAMRYLVAQIDKPNIEWPKSLQRYRSMLIERKDLLKLWHNKITPSISRHLSSESFVKDVSLLLHILSPPNLRPVALHLLSESEKDNLTQLVDTMASYSITYKHSKPEALQKTQTFGASSDIPVLSFDPPIEDFVKFKDYQSGHSGLSLAMKRVLVHEVEKQRILRESIGRSVDLTNKINSENQGSTMVSAQVKPAIIATKPASIEGSNTPKATLVQRQKIASIASYSHSDNSNKFPAIGMSLKAPGDLMRPASCSASFFDRFRKGISINSKNPGDTLQKAATTERDSRPFLFKYNEGFTNAVKRPVKIRELLL